MTDNPKDDERQVKPFAQTLVSLNGGAIHNEASERLADLVTAVRDTGKKGSITVTVEVRPLKGTKDQLVVAAAVGLKAPKAEPRTAVFFVDGDGNLTRDDPNQLAIEGLRVVEPKPARTVNATTQGV